MHFSVYEQIDGIYCIQAGKQLFFSHDQNPPNSFLFASTGTQSEREMAQKYIRALYETGHEYRDDMVAVPAEMYDLFSAAPVLRHITRHSGAVVYVTQYGSAHVRPEEIHFI